ncbi:MAG TPA: amidohydrolase family protein [Caldilineaceae bacterium]|nr:amidohydrolase family protein [Caldilineaceae bacterium]
MIDAHIHYGDDAPALLALLAEYDLKLVNICVAEDAHGAWRGQADNYHQLAQSYPERFAWVTSFDLPRFGDPHYLDQTVADLQADFAKGAIGCKVWKNIGMEGRCPDRAFLLPDDPLLDPIYETVAASGKTLLTHIAEPLACWQPLNEQNPHYGYYSRNPQWHMYGRNDFPAHEALMAARDRVLAKHPQLRMVGAHLASLEYDVGVLAARLDRYPNLAVDISARLVDLANQDSAKVRDFFIRYQERILFGTDVVMRTRPSALPPAEHDAAIAALRATYELHIAYLAGDQPLAVRGFATTGLNLPAAVLERIYRQNVQEWYPGA